MSFSPARLMAGLCTLFLVVFSLPALALAPFKADYRAPTWA